MTVAMHLRHAVISAVLLAGLAAGCGSDEATRTNDATDPVSPSGSVGSDLPASDPTALTAPDASTGGAVAGDVSMTFTVLNSEKNPSLNGVPATVIGSCSIQAQYDLFQLSGGTMSATDAADRPDSVTFIGNAPVDGTVSGLLTVVELGVESSSLTAQGTFDGTTLSITDADTAEPLFELVLSAPCTES